MTLADAVNKAWKDLYFGEPCTDERALVTRVNMIASDVQCGRTNFRVTNQAYVKLDNTLRQIAWYWPFQFWWAKVRRRNVLHQREHRSGS